MRFARSLGAPRGTFVPRSVGGSGGRKAFWSTGILGTSGVGCGGCLFRFLSLALSNPLKLNPTYCSNACLTVPPGSKQSPSVPPWLHALRSLFKPFERFWNSVSCPRQLVFAILGSEHSSGSRGMVRIPKVLSNIQHLSTRRLSIS